MKYTILTLTAILFSTGLYAAEDSSITYVSTHADRSNTITVSESVIIQYCGDGDGCMVQLAMADYNTAGEIASRVNTVYYNETTKRWRVSNDASGNTNNGSTQHLFSAWACYFTDGIYINGANQGDQNANFGLYNSTSYNAECRLTIHD